jgi:hypothetical protein
VLWELVVDFVDIDGDPVLGVLEQADRLASCVFIE